MILNKHSQVSIAPETHFFRVFWSKRKKYGDLKCNSNFYAFWKECSESKYFNDLGFTNLKSIQRKLEASDRSYKSIIQILLKEYAEKYGKMRWGEKTPGHFLYINTILSLFPEARIIHVIRDPRAVALSNKKVPWGHRDVFAHARLWNKYMKTSINYATYHAKSYMEIKYEELVTNATPTIKRMCSFINVGWEKAMLHYYKDSREFIEKNEEWKNNCNEPITNRNIEIWKNELTDAEKEEIQIKCAKWMEKKGYLPSCTRAGQANKLLIFKLALYQYRWFMRASYRKLNAKLK
jgi:hypothetical protein